VMRQAFAGLLWSKQFYHYVVRTGWRVTRSSRRRPRRAAPGPQQRLAAPVQPRHHLDARQVGVPVVRGVGPGLPHDPVARIDPHFAKEQLNCCSCASGTCTRTARSRPTSGTFRREPAGARVGVLARVQDDRAARESATALFLARVFHKLLINFTWWVNRKDPRRQHLFLAAASSGSTTSACSTAQKPLPTAAGWSRPMARRGWRSTAHMLRWRSSWRGRSGYEDIASKFFEHFVAIADAMNTSAAAACGTRRTASTTTSCKRRARSGSRCARLVGVIPLFAVESVEDDMLDKLPGFNKRMQWFLENRKDLARHSSRASGTRATRAARAPAALLAIPSRERLMRLLRYVLDEGSSSRPTACAPVARSHARTPVRAAAGGAATRGYVPAESDGLFGGNSNWRGPIWFPLNFLLIEALERYHHFYGDRLEGRVPHRQRRRLTCSRSRTNCRGGCVAVPARRRGRAPSRQAGPLRRDPH
jgi:hypothetical protein